MSDVKDFINKMLNEASKSNFPIRKKDLWDLTCVRYPNHPTSKYWLDPNKKGNGLPPDINDMLNNDNRFDKWEVNGKKKYVSKK